MSRQAGPLSAVVEGLQWAARAAGQFWPGSRQEQSEVRLEVEELSAELMSELDRLARRNEALRRIIGQEPYAYVGRGSPSERRQCEIAALRHQVTAASEGLTHLRGRRLAERRLALDLLRIEVSALALELESLEASRISDAS